MHKSEVEAICAAVGRGGKLYIGRNHFGKTKLKLQRGPFGLWVTRFEANDAQIEAIRARLARSEPKIPHLKPGKGFEAKTSNI